MCSDKIACGLSRTEYRRWKSVFKVVCAGGGGVLVSGRSGISPSVRALLVVGLITCLCLQIFNILATDFF